MLEILDFESNEGADQLRSYCEADLRLCFRLYTLFVFSYFVYVLLVLLSSVKYIFYNSKYFLKDNLNYQ